MGDGSELEELFQCNISEIAMLNAKINLAQGLSIDLGKQKDQAFGLIVECRDLLAITALESPLHKDIFELIAKIDEFYPQPVIERY